MRRPAEKRPVEKRPDGKRPKSGRIRAEMIGSADFPVKFRIIFLVKFWINFSREVLDKKLDSAAGIGYTLFCC